jgi:hypothetical protein
MLNPPDLTAEIENLKELPMPQLRKRWNRNFNTSVPKGFSRDLIIRSLTYKIQEGAHGGLNQATKRKLRTFAKQLEADDTAAFDIGPNLKPGTKLVREWQGQRHTVTVLENGFEYSGDRYGSLSMIARKITGTRWSGPRFFGLKNNEPKKKKGVQNDE